MIGETLVTNVISNLILQHKIDRWMRLLISCMMSGLVTLVGVCGAGIITHIETGSNPNIALVLGFAEGLLASAAVVFNLWRRSELTKSIPLTVPRAVEQEETEILRDQGMITLEKK